MLNFFAVPITDEWGTTYQLTTAGYTALVLIMIALLLLACFIGNSISKPRFSTRQLVFSAMAIAAAMVTSFIKLFDLPMGGSVTLLSMLFICLIGYWYGLRAGLMTAIAYGFLQLISDPYIISLPQMLVDYIFAFGALGLSGVFSNSKNGLIKGYLLGVLGRYFFAFLSGLIFFGVYAADYNMSAPVYSLVYNGAYLGAEALLTIIVLSLPPIKKVMAQLKTMAKA
ncbi:MAG TPA: energy-coupled thiamine transporter ThiT [Candidatus Eisenbergiella pullicola]|nr:energy-coupled thiamine transporter ThiT [Candidatus Eisenbergiella pullicola]